MKFKINHSSEFELQWKLRAKVSVHIPPLQEDSSIFIGQPLNHFLILVFI